MHGLTLERIRRPTYNDREIVESSAVALAIGARVRNCDETEPSVYLERGRAMRDDISNRTPSMWDTDTKSRPDENGTVT